MRLRLPALGLLLVAALGVGAGCSMLVESELTRVNCSWEGAIGPPACPPGQACRAGVCAPCGKTEICGNGVDDDCSGAADDNCGGAGGTGGFGATGGVGGDMGGAPGGGGVAGSGTGGVGGSSGGSGGSTSGGGSAGSGGSTGGSGGSTGGAGGSGGTTAGAIGATCASNAECNAGLFCDDPAVFGAAGGTDLCSRGCCKSEDCGSGSSVCYPAVDGGSACVPGSSVGRAEIGTKPAGSTCTKNNECRSGLCDTGTCFDACCSNSDCPGSQYCVRRTLPGTTRQVMACGKNPGNGGFLAPCSVGSGCQSGLCLQVGVCTKTCCTSKDCAGTVSLSCIHAGGLRYCASYSGGSKTLGASCAASSECKSGYCISPGSYCSDTCCSDFDCGAGFACRPASLNNTNHLLCLKL